MNGETALQRYEREQSRTAIRRMVMSGAWGVAMIMVLVGVNAGLCVCIPPAAYGAPDLIWFARDWVRKRRQRRAS